MEVQEEHHYTMDINLEKIKKACTIIEFK